MPRRSDRFGRAWLSLTLALAAHVTDEALTDFLSFYNPTVLAIRERVAWFPMPTFAFGPWLGGLIALIIVLLLLWRVALRGSAIARVLAYPFAIVIGLLNGVGHLLGSIYYGRWLPGTTTAPILVGCGLWLLVTAHQSPDHQPPAITNPQPPIPNPRHPR